MAWKALIAIGRNHKGTAQERTPNRSNGLCFFS